MKNFSIFLLVLGTLFVVAFGKHIHPRSIVRMEEDAGDEAQTIATDIDGMPIVSALLYIFISWSTFGILCTWWWSTMWSNTNRIKYRSNNSIRPVPTEVKGQNNYSQYDEHCVGRKHVLCFLPRFHCGFISLPRSLNLKNVSMHNLHINYYYVNTTNYL